MRDLLTLAMARKGGSGGSSGGESGELFVVNVTPTDDTTFTADKTFAEIEEAHENGKFIYAVVNFYDEYEMYLFLSENECGFCFIFSNTFSYGESSLRIDANNTVFLTDEYSQAIIYADPQLSTLDYQISAIKSAILGGKPVYLRIGDGGDKYQQFNIGYYETFYGTGFVAYFFGMVYESSDVVNVGYKFTYDFETETATIEGLY